MQLDSLGVDEYYSALFLRPANYENIAAYFGKLIGDHAGEIKKVVPLLSDDKSREVFEGILHARQLTDQRSCLEISGELYTPNMYFPDDVPGFSLGQEESFVDAGAFTGDTIEKFLKKVDGQYSGIFAFEPDPSNYANLENFCEGREKIRLFHSGLFSRNDILRFQQSKDFKETPRIIAGNKPPAPSRETGVIEVAVEALDNIPEIKPTLIKMDIEGSEMEALHGAASVIKNNMPKLAVCLYHKITDFWEIPLFLHEAAPEYKLYVRHHIISPHLIDTVLYATS
jgi:FkbM family methyltransferase